MIEPQQQTGLSIGGNLLIYVTETSRGWIFLQVWLDPDVQIIIFTALILFSGRLYLQLRFTSLINNDLREGNQFLLLVPESLGMVYSLV